MLVDGHMCQHRSSFTFTMAHGEGRGTRERRAEVVLVCTAMGAGALCVRSATGTTGAGVAKAATYRSGLAFQGFALAS